MSSWFCIFTWHNFSQYFLQIFVQLGCYCVKLVIVRGLILESVLLSLSCLNTFRNYSVSLSYLASRSSRDRSTLVMGLNILTLISSSLKYQLIYLNMRTISLRYSIEFFTYVECLLCIISTSFFKSAQATSGVIPILKVELWSTADIQSKATAMSAWERVYNALSILPCFQ